MCSSLAASLLSLGSTGCLVTSTPEFQEPERTPPFLISSSAEPRPTELLLVSAQGGSLTEIQFSAAVRSEDTGAPVRVFLFFDYGGENSFGQPYAFKQEFTPLAPSTLDDKEPRVARAALPGGIWAQYPGCHTVTMMVTHDLDANSGCPTQLGDSSQLTWFVYACKVGESCPAVDDDVLGCPDSGDAAEVCPSSADGSGGGAP